MKKRVEIINDPNLEYQDPTTQLLLKLIVHRTRKRPLTAQELVDEVCHA